MKTQLEKYFPYWHISIFSFLVLLLLFGCNSEDNIPDIMDGTLSLTKITKPDSITNESVAEVDLLLQNTGLKNVTVDSFEITEGKNLFTLAGGNCNSNLLTLAPGETCNYVLNFSSEIPGDFTLALDISYHSEDSQEQKILQITLAMKVTSSDPPPIFRAGTLELASGDTHGDVFLGEEKEITYILKNSGTEHLRIDEYYLEGPQIGFFVTGGNCRNTDFIIGANETCSLVVKFIPEAQDQYTQQLTIGYYPGDTWAWKSFNLSLSGSGVQAPSPEPTPVPTPSPDPVPTPTPDPDPVPTPSPSPSTGRLHVDGRFIKDEGGNVVVLKGVNIADPEHLDLKPWERPGVTAMSVVKNAVENYHANVIRVPIHPGSPSYPNEGWFGNSGGQRYLDDHVIPLVNYLTSKKVYTIIDLHYVSNWSGLYPKVAAFWNLVAPVFKDNPYVIYEVFNEPIYPDDWNGWKNEIAQPAVDLIRRHAPDNLIIVGGPLWSAHMAGAADNPISGKNIVYTAHIYSNQWPNHIGKNFGRTVEELPVFVTEWGFESGGTEGGNKSAYGVPFEQWMSDHQFSWTAWCFDNRWGPRMFDSNWNLLSGDGGMGQFVKELLQGN